MNKLLAMLGLFLLISMFAVNSLGAQDFENIEAQIQSNPKIPQLIFEVIEFAKTNKLNTSSVLRNFGIASRADHKILVEVQYGFDAEKEIPIQENWKGTFEMDAKYRNVVGGWIQPEDIISFAESLPKEYFILGPSTAILPQTGDSVTNATSYMNNVSGGLGLKVAIFEPTFGGVYSSQANGTVPTPFFEHDFSGSGDPFDNGGVHGTATTEVIYHFAPHAEFHLYKFTTQTQFANAMADAISEGVDIVNLSIGFLNTGWNDGSGIPNMAVKDATNAGILVFCAANNLALVHWQGDFDDGVDSDGLHTWEGTDEGNDILVLNNTNLTACLQWKGNPTINNNFNIQFRNSLTGDLLASTSATTGYEKLAWLNTTGASVQVAVIVIRLNSSQSEFEIIAINGSSNNFQYSQTGSSIIAPATSGEDMAIVVGAVSRVNYDGPIIITEPYSGVGPSNGGRILPDILAPTDLITYSYPNGFSGTSAATPCAAGIALLFWSEHDYLSVEGLIDVLYGFTNLYNPWGGSGTQDNTWGRGGIELPNYKVNSRFIIEGVINNNVNNRPYNSVEQVDAIAPSNRNIFFLGGTFDAPTAPASNVLNKKMIYRSLKEDAIIRE